MVLSILTMLSTVLRAMYTVLTITAKITAWILFIVFFQYVQETFMALVTLLVAIAAYACGDAGWWLCSRIYALLQLYYQDYPCRTYRYGLAILIGVAISYYPAAKTAVRSALSLPANPSDTDTDDSDSDTVVDSDSETVEPCACHCDSDCTCVTETSKDRSWAAYRRVVWGGLLVWIFALFIAYHTWNHRITDNNLGRYEKIAFELAYALGLLYGINLDFIICICGLYSATGWYLALAALMPDLNIYIGVAHEILGDVRDELVFDLKLFKELLDDADPYLMPFLLGAGRVWCAFWDIIGCILVTILDACFYLVAYCKSIGERREKPERPARDLSNYPVYCYGELYSPNTAAVHWNRPMTPPAIPLIPAFMRKYLHLERIPVITWARLDGQSYDHPYNCEPQYLHQYNQHQYDYQHQYQHPYQNQYHNQPQYLHQYQYYQQTAYHHQYQQAQYHDQLNYQYQPQYQY